MFLKFKKLCPAATTINDCVYCNIKRGHSCQEIGCFAMIILELALPSLPSVSDHEETRRCSSHIQ